MSGNRESFSTTTGDDKLDHGENYVLNPAFWENGQALGFPIQFNLVLKHLRQDMRDDWYFDCLQYDDFFNDPNEAKRIIVSLLAEWNGVYLGTRSVVRNIPKKGYGERYGLETDFFDRFTYQAICSFLIPYYDKVLSHRVLSYRYDPRPLNTKYLFKNKISRWFSQVVQGTASLIFKKALLEVGKVEDVTIVLPMHDALLFEHHLVETPGKVVEIFEAVMTAALDNRITGKASVGEFAPAVA